jgi:hypothetical protein
MALEQPIPCNSRMDYVSRPTTGAVLNSLLKAAIRYKQSSGQRLADGARRCAVADQQGYIYHRQHLLAADLGVLITNDAQGWAAEPTCLWKMDDSSELGDEGRATVGMQEFRWRRTADDRYDVLCLSLSAEAPVGFERLPHYERWAIRRTTCREPGPGRTPDTDAERPAIAFLALNGAVQFVALIDENTREGIQHGL